MGLLDFLKFKRAEKTRDSFDDFLNILAHGNDKNQGADYISCKIEPDDMADFAELKDYQTYKFTVVGKFDATFNLSLEQCRLVNAEKTASK